MHCNKIPSSGKAPAGRLCLAHVSTSCTNYFSWFSTRIDAVTCMRTTMAVLDLRHVLPRNGPQAIGIAWWTVSVIVALFPEEVVIWPHNYLEWTIKYLTLVHQAPFTFLSPHCASSSPSHWTSHWCIIAHLMKENWRAANIHFCPASEMLYVVCQLSYGRNL
jgi:hypothetical protein